MITLGKDIVSNYLRVKDVYENLIDQKPDFKELLYLSISFNQNVLNFEVEAL